MTPRPPACAMAMARRASVTVSMAEEMIGMLSSMVARQAGADVDLARHDEGMTRLQQHVVEGERLATRAELDDLCHANASLRMRKTGRRSGDHRQAEEEK